MIKILIVGANGQLGKCVQKIEQNYPEFQFIFKNSKELDITKKEKVEILFGTLKPDFCINCAAYTNVEQAEKNPKRAYQVNSEGVKILALTCKSNNTILIHISTDYVFDGEKEKSYTIKDIPNPINEYGKSKLLGEKYIIDILDKYLIVRTSWLYSEFGKNFYKTILEKTKSNEILEITSNQIGCPTNANNLAKYILNFLVKKSVHYGIHHYTDGEVMSWYDFAEKILKENGIQDSVRLERARNYRTFAKRPKNSVLKNTFSQEN